MQLRLIELKSVSCNYNLVGVDGAKQLQLEVDGLTVIVTSLVLIWPLESVAANLNTYLPAVNPVAVVDAEFNDVTVPPLPDTFDQPEEAMVALWGVDVPIKLTLDVGKVII